MAGCRKKDCCEAGENSLFASWKLVQVENKTTFQITPAPQNLKLRLNREHEMPYIIEFSDSGTVNFHPSCNFECGRYSIENQDSIKFEKLFPGTEVYCGELSDWEEIVINNLSKSLTYSLSGNMLVIDCEDNKLYFQRLLSSDFTLGIGEQYANLVVDSINESRCPIGVTCDWAGSADVSFTYSKDAVNQSFMLGTYRFPHDILIIDNLYIRLISVAPYPEVGKPIEREDYKVRIKITNY